MRLGEFNYLLGIYMGVTASIHIRVNLKAFNRLVDHVLNSGLICTLLLDLNRRFVSNRHHSLNPSLRIDGPLFPRSQRLPLQEHVHTLSFGLLLLPCIVLNPVDEFLS